MKPIRTEHTQIVFELPGGTKENDLPAYKEPESGALCSVWEPTQEERARIFEGANLRLAVWMQQQPPVVIEVTDEQAI